MLVWPSTAAELQAFMSFRPTRLSCPCPLLTPAPTQPRYHCERSMAAAARYSELAKRKGLSLAQLALAWCKSRWWVRASRPAWPRRLWCCLRPAPALVLSGRAFSGERAQHTLRAAGCREGNQGKAFPPPRSALCAIC